MRDGIDDRGMELISHVNCTMAAYETPLEWRNAQWWQKKMWYGQVKDAKGVLKSFSKYLDIIAHELTHGVTETTAGLVYCNQSGALNESFSDIFGILIRNWDWAKPETGGEVTEWNWEIGSGLGELGLPLRDIGNPTRTGDPDHMDKYILTTEDSGGVHWNSNIHNEAAHYILIAKDDADGYVFTPRQVAEMYYHCLLRLGELASFTQARHTLINVAGVYFAGDTQRKDRLDAIRRAYDKVGITG